jgi:FSR family fosmidomycin resistance protein-like MFS transporter
MIAEQVQVLRDRSYLAVVSTHFCVDLMNNSRTVLAAILAVALGLNNAQLGLFVLFYSLGNAVSQPGFGWLADRFGVRRLIVGGLGWMIFFYALAAFVSPWLALVSMTIASLGSGAFHPSGTKYASEASAGAQSTATAFFFTAGQLGLFLGPILTGTLIQLYDRPGFIMIPLISLVVFAFGYLWLNEDAVAAIYKEEDRVAVKMIPAGVPRVRRRLFIPLLIIFPLTTTASLATLNFAPKLFTELNYSPSYVGWIGGLLMLGSAIGVTLGGALADRINSKLVVLLGLLGMGLPIYFYIPAPDPWRFVLLFLAGLFSGMPHSILVLKAQGLLPGRRALASGLTLGFMFAGGALGSYLVGVLADNIGLAPALQSVALLPLLAFVAALFLPRE